MDNQIIEQVQILLSKAGEIGDFVYTAAYRRVIYTGFAQIAVGLFFFISAILLRKASHNEWLKRQKERTGSIDFESYGVTCTMAFLSMIVCAIIGLAFVYAGLGNLFSPDWSTIETIISLARGPQL